MSKDSLRIFFPLCVPIATIRFSPEESSITSTLLNYTPLCFIYQSINLEHSFFRRWSFQRNILQSIQYRAIGRRCEPRATFSPTRFDILGTHNHLQSTHLVEVETRAFDRKKKVTNERQEQQITQRGQVWSTCRVLLVAWWGLQGHRRSTQRSNCQCTYVSV